MTNIRQVANKAGVSIGTVSRVLNNRPGVSEKTRQHVLSVARELNYIFPRRSRFSNSEVTHLGFLIGPLKQKLAANPFYADVFHGVEQACRQLHINLSYSSLGTSNGHSFSFPPLVKDDYISGLVVAGGGVSRELVESLTALSQLPVVLADNWFFGCGWDAVMIDNVYGARLSTEFLIEKGHRRIALIGGPNHPSIVERRLGYEETLRQHNLKPTIVTPEDLSHEDGQWGVREILRQSPETTGIVCSNDEQAVGALRKLRELGYQVPDDFSLVGFDDINLVQFTTPPITTILVDRLAIGQIAMQLLLERIKNPNRPIIKVTIGVKLVERASVCSPRSHKIIPSV